MMQTAEWIFEHTTPDSLLWFGLFASLVWMAFAAWRYLPKNPTGWLIIALRGLFLFLLFWILLLPGKKRNITEIAKSRFIVLLDTTASMGQSADPEANRTRWEAAQAVLNADGLAKVASRSLVEVYPFSSDLTPPVTLEQAKSLTPDGTSSHLNLGLHRLFDRLRGQDVSGALLLTDGIDTREKKDTWSEASWPVPIYVAELEKPGLPDDKPDMRIDTVDTPQRAVVGWDTTLTATVAGQGGKGEAFSVILYKNGKEQEKVAVKIPAEGGSRDVQVKLTHPEIGSEQYRVAIPVLPDEAQTNDNEMVVMVEVLDAKNRVLFLENEPRFESKHLSRTLFKNKDITPLAFFQIPDKRSPGAKTWVPYGDRQGLSFDMTVEQLLLNKIIILGDFDAEALSPEHCRAILEFVEKGGSLILLGGQKFWGERGVVKTELVKALPFTRSGAPAIEGKFAVEWTAEGRSHPAFANDKEVPEELPPVLSVFTGASLSGAALTLAEARTEQGAQPILVSRVYGQGKVLAVLTDSLWRWTMQPGDVKPYPKFWRQIIQWMSPSASDLDRYHLELFTDAGTISVGDPAILQSRLVIPPEETRKNWKVACEVTTPSDRTIPLSMAGKTIQSASGGEFPGYVSEFTPSEPRTYRAIATVEVDGKKIASAPCLFSVRSTSQETILKPINERVLRNIARASGGRYGRLESLNPALQELRIRERSERKLEYHSLWQTPFMVLFLILLLTIEWVIRKLRNMV